MPRGKLTKEEIKTWVLRFKKELSEDPTEYSDPKNLANKYLNKILDKIDEYAS
mgnify:CR=1 FL=1|tara:strand:+ start:5617 stop:5775 length:159 start_codon:yes stop_codon:yes gene_type:complete